MKTPSFSGKVAAITGAGSGIGRTVLEAARRHRVVRAAPFEAMEHDVIVVGASQGFHSISWPVKAAGALASGRVMVTVVGEVRVKIALSSPIRVEVLANAPSPPEGPLTPA